MRQMVSYYASLHRLQECLEDVHLWMVANKLKLAEDQTELMVSTTPYYRMTFTHYRYFRISRKRGG